METVLVVDDSPTQREMIAALLQSHNFAVWLAEDGAEALERAQQTSPDLILLDVLMPGMNGYEACRQLKGHPLTKDIPVVICSSKTTPIDHHWGKKLGAVAYVDKPSYEEKLVKTLRKVLAYRRKKVARQRMENGMLELLSKPSASNGNMTTA